MQNNLNEYYAMINWVTPGLMGTPEEFKTEFADPVQEGETHFFHGGTCAGTGRAFLSVKNLTVCFGMHTFENARV